MQHKLRVCGWWEFSHITERKGKLVFTTTEFRISLEINTGIKPNYACVTGIIKLVLHLF